MFCYQCEQTAKGEGCTKMGVCGKDDTTAKMQDLLVESAKRISQYAHRARHLGAKDEAVDNFVMDALFATVTNVDFDPERLQGHLNDAGTVFGKAKQLYENACAEKGETPQSPPGMETYEIPQGDIEALAAQGEKFSVESRKEQYGEDVAGVQELTMYGLKGAAAYETHARILGKVDPEVAGAFHEVISALADGESDLDKLLPLALKAGEINLKVMELLDAANTGAYGHPEPTEVRVTPVKGKAICVSGHDLKDLEDILKQTEGKGINVYTHGEMLPCHGYPGLKKYKHLVGNYGGAWQDQAKEFDAFPGAIVMTTNCIQRPRDSYRDRIFTCGLTAWPGVQHIGDHDYTPAIEAALAAPGFEEDGEDKKIMVGFGHEAVLGVADKVVEAVKSGAVRHFFLVGGCDGAKSGRNYYTEFAQQIPDDCVIMTLACGKYRFNKMEFGDIGGIPRLLDIGQCNDSYSAVQIAVALANAFDCSVNDLPLSFILSWYEQKAVAILLSLLHLGITGIRLGPSLPAFVTPSVLNVLVEKFGIQPIGTPEEDLKAVLA